MTSIPLVSRVRLVALWCWGFMAFCLPFSTALTILFSGLGLIFALVGFDWRAFKQALMHPIGLLCVSLFFWLALSSAWSVAPEAELLEGLSKYRKLLFVPILGMLLISTNKSPRFFLKFFIAGCVLVSLGSLSSSSGLLEHLIGPQLPQGGWALGGTAAKHWFYIGPPETPTFGRAFIAQGAFLVIAAMFVFGRLLDELLHSGAVTRPRGLRVIALGCLAVLMVAVMVNLGGRTGYALLAVGAALWTVSFLVQGQRTRALLFGVVMVLVGFTISTSEKFTQRVELAAQDVEQYKASGALTSQGLRLRFWEAGLQYGLERPLTGWGVGAYGEVFSRDETQPASLRESRPHPHSEYVSQWVQGGAVALILFVLLGVQVARPVIGPSAGLPPVQIALTIGTTLLFVDGLFNSVVWDLGEGHLLVVLLAGLSVGKADDPPRSSEATK